MNLYTPKQLADAAGVTVRTVQRACVRVGIVRRPLVIVGERERKQVAAAIRGTVGNPDFADPQTNPKTKRR